MALIFISIPIAFYLRVLIIRKDIPNNDIEKIENDPSDSTDDETWIKQNVSSSEDKTVHSAVTHELEQSKSQNRTDYEEISIEKEIVDKLEDLLIPINEKMQKMLDSLETTSIVRKQKENLERSLVEYINGYNFSMLKNAIDELIDAYEATSDINTLFEQNTSSIDKDQAMNYTIGIFNYLQQGFQIAGIEQFQPEIGSMYQKEIGVELVERIVTQDKSKIGTIAKTLRPGWITTLPETDNLKRKMIRKAQVSVYIESE